MEPRAAAGKHGSGRELRAGGTTSMMCSHTLCHRTIGELVLANRELQDVVAFYRELVGHVSEQAYESFTASVGLPPDRRRFSLADGPSVDELLDAMRGAG